MRLRFCFCSHIHCVLLLSHLLLQPFTLCTRVCVCVWTPDCVCECVCFGMHVCVCISRCVRFWLDFFTLCFSTVFAVRFVVFRCVFSCFYFSFIILYLMSQIGILFFNFSRIVLCLKKCLSKHTIHTHTHTYAHTHI